MWTRRVARKRRAGLAVALALALHGALAQSPPSPPAAEALIVTVRANGVARGEFTLLRQPDGDYWVPAGDLQRLALAPAEAARRMAGNEPHFSLRALGAANFALNEADLSLAVDFPASRMEGTRLDLTSRPPPLPEMRPQNSLILSYRLSARQDSGGDRPQIELATDLNARVAGILLRNESQFRSGVTEGRRVRGVTQAIYDDLPRGTRWVAGDVLTTAGRFGSTTTGGGLMVRRYFDLTPDLVRQPMANLRAVAQLPSDVEVSVDGTTVLRTRVGPGPIAIDNLESYGGARNVRVTVTDIAGRREVFEQPFLFTDQVLAPGLHDFSYFAGKRSEATPDGFDYAEPAWQGVHSYGLTDSLTLAAGGEGTRHFTSGGVGATLRSDRLGLVAADLLASSDRQHGLQARGWALRYAYVVPNASLLFERRRFGEGYRNLVTTPLRPHPLDETRIGAAVRIGRVNVAADLQRIEDALEVRRVRQARVSTQVAPRVMLSGLLQSIQVNQKSDWSAFVFLRFDLDAQRWVSAVARTGSGGRGLDLETGRQIGNVEGFGYRAGLIATQAEGATSSIGYFNGTWNLKPVSLQLFGSSPIGGGTAFGEATVSGAVVAMPGFFGLTRRINDGFVIADLGVPQPGVDILLNNQVQGQTDGKGRVFIPEVGSYIRQEVSLNDRQLGMEYGVEAKRRTIAVPYRSGLAVNFGARRVRALAGMVWLQAEGRKGAAGAGALVLQQGANTLRTETSAGGDFYLDDAPPGTYTGRFEAAGKTYSCRVTVPDFPEPVHELKEGVLCD
jgi:outer membrane usher protein